MANELTETEQIAAARRGTGALSGAATGAKAGAQYAGGWGALVGGLIGAGVGAFGAGGATEAEIERARRIQELKRLRSMDALGLTPEERAQLEAQLLTPVRAQQRAQQEAVLRAAATQDLGAGSFYAQSMAMDRDTQMLLAEQKARIEAAQLQAAAEQRQEMSDLLAEQEAAVKEERRALVGSILGVGEAALEIGGSEAEIQAAQQEAADTMEAATGQEGTSDDYDAWTQFINLYGEV